MMQFWTTRLTETLTLAWIAQDATTVNRGTSARTQWTVAGVLEENAADALRAAVRQALDHRPVAGVRGRAAVAESLCHTIAQLCTEAGHELLALQIELEHGYCVRWQLHPVEP